MDWAAFYRLDAPEIQRLLQPEDWQVWLAGRIQATAATSILEAGSGYGLVSLLLASERVRPVLLDREPAPLLTAHRLFAVRARRGDFVNGDLFSLPFADGRFDLVFNAGVLEHFDFDQRVAALGEMARVTRLCGRMLVAVPNHFSRPYRYSYLHRKKRGQWPYPDEEAIFDLSEEIRAAGLNLRVCCETGCVDTAYFFLRRHQRWLFRLAALARPNEGYLRLFVMEKRGVRGGD